MAQRQIDLIPWNDKLNTGIADIDEQHRQLVEIINDLAVKIAIASQAEVRAALDALTDYAQFHFATEEAIWNEHLSDSSDSNDHQQSHQQFVSDLQAIEARMADKSASDIGQEILRFLIQWLVIHIISDDKRLAYIITQLQSGQSLDQARESADNAFKESIALLADIIMNMYQSLSTTTIDLIRESDSRERAEQSLKMVNEHLSHLATIDELTGLYNRRQFEETISNELKRARRDKNDLALIMLDIDYFKRLNDEYGHAAGDKALASIGNTLSKLCQRPGDFAFRVGGEEFVVLLATTKMIQAQTFAHLVLDSIQELQIENKGSDIADTLTVSIGISVYNQDNDVDPEQLFNQADARLYKAKQNGRNQIVSSD